MSNNVATKQPTTTKKAYHRPELKPLGSVQGLTLKQGSTVDLNVPSDSNFS